MTKAQLKFAVSILLAFVAGVLVGYFEGQALFGYKSIEECRARETKGVMIPAATYAASAYCDTLFPAPKVEVVETEAALDAAAEAMKP